MSQSLQIHQNGSHSIFGYVLPCVYSKKYYTYPPNANLNSCSQENYIMKVVLLFVSLFLLRLDLLQGLISLKKSNFFPFNLKPKKETSCYNAINFRVLLTLHILACIRSLIQIIYITSISPTHFIIEELLWN